MACERYREAVADVAAGLPAPAGLDAHLARCEACRAELRVLRQALAMADAQMAGLLAAEPTPELAVRIRQAVEMSPALARARRAVADSNEPSRQRWSVLEDEAAAWRFGWLWPATATAATLLVTLAVVLGRGTLSAPEPRVTVDANRSQPTGSFGASGPSGDLVTPREDRPVPVADGINDVVTPRSSGQAERRGVRSPGGSLGTRQDGVPRDDNAPARSRSAGRRRIAAEPEVLVPPGEGEALLRFVALVHRERLAPTSFAAAGEPSADLAELASIDIKPLEIVPLDPAATSGT